VVSLLSQLDGTATTKIPLTALVVRL
jgi:hypothetical protein